MSWLGLIVLAAFIMALVALEHISTLEARVRVIEEAILESRR